MTIDEMLPLREPTELGEDAPLDRVRIISGKLNPDDPDGPLAGSVMIRPVWNGKRRMWRGPVTGWEWRECDPPTLEQKRTLPCWDGIQNGHQVTKGHVLALRDGGWLK